MITIDTSTLSTLEGVGEAAVVIAKNIAIEMMKPVVRATPDQLRQYFFEAFFAALSGAVVAEIGDERAQKVFRKVVEALQLLEAEEKVKH